MIHTVLLDLDDTILDFHKAEALALSDTPLALGIAPEPDRVRLYSEINAAQWRRLEAGEITRAEVLTSRFALLFQALGVERSCELAQQLYEERLSQGHYFIDGAVEMLQTLSKKYALFLVSNGNLRVQEGRLKSAAISQYFQDIFISERIGADKPSRAFFDACFARIPGLDRSGCVIVGDSLTSDIRGGINAGIRTIWFNPARRPPAFDVHPDHEIHALHEHAPLLRSLCAQTENGE